MVKNKDKLLLNSGCFLKDEQYLRTAIQHVKYLCIFAAQIGEKLLASYCIMTHLFSLTFVIRRGHNYTELDLSPASIK
jgi:hypothetical protein